MVKIAYRIKKFGVFSIAKFFAVIGFVWGFLSGLIILISYIWGYTTDAQTSLLVTGLTGFGMMVVSGVAGGFLGGIVIAWVYNNVLGSKHGIQLDLE